MHRFIVVSWLTSNANYLNVRKCASKDLAILHRRIPTSKLTKASSCFKISSYSLEDLIYGKLLLSVAACNYDVTLEKLDTGRGDVAFPSLKQFSSHKTDLAKRVIVRLCCKDCVEVCVRRGLR